MLFQENKKEKIQLFLKKIGAEKISHIKGKTFFDHLVSVADLLESWDLPPRVVFAGMCHTLYASEVFKTALLDINHREELQSLIGKDAEQLVFLFCSIKRNSLIRDDTGVFSFSLNNDKGSINVEEEEACDLLHILLANDMDHIGDLNVHGMSAYFTRRYMPWKDFFCMKAEVFLVKFSAHPSRIPARAENFVRFTGHAGVQICADNSSLVIDPWIYASTRQKPRMQGFDPNNATIDFLIPEPRNTIKDLESDVVLLSHFHTHHAPLQEITELVGMRPIHIVCPPLSESRLTKIKAALGETLFASITFHFVDKDMTLTIGAFTIRAMYHLRNGHLGFLVTTKHGSVFHLSDPTANNGETLAFDPVWKKFDNLNPDFAFISCGGHSVRKIVAHGERLIKENETFTPTQAAKFAINLGANTVGVIGIYNHSVWTDRLEFSRGVGAIEGEFFWALSYLAPSVRILTLRPGDIFPLMRHPAKS